MVFYCEQLLNYLRANPEIETLHLANCLLLREIPVLPKSLTSLSVENCPQLTRLVGLPRRLLHLRIVGCENLRHLPQLPSKLQTLHIDHCSQLAAPSTPKHLVTFWFNFGNRFDKQHSLKAGQDR